jgi:AAA domain
MPCLGIRSGVQRSHRQARQPSAAVARLLAQEGGTPPVPDQRDQRDGGDRIEFAYTTLKEAAAKAGLRLEQEEVRPREPHVINPDADWSLDKPGPQAILERYRSRTCNRRSALVGFASGIAMSALHAGYDLSNSELAGIVEDAHHANPSTSKRTQKEFTAIANTAQDWANRLVSQPAHIKKAEWDAYFQSEMERIERDIREAAIHGDAENFAAGDNDPDEPTKPEASKPRKRFYSSADCRLVKPPKWQVEGLIPENFDVAIYGVSGTLKSFVALDLAMSVTTALNAFGIMEIKEAKPVFYFAGEGFHNIIKKRQVAWQLHCGLESYSTGDLWFVDGVPLVNNESSVEADIQEMVSLLDGRSLGVFVIDTLSRALNGEDEDRSNSASRYFARLHQIRAACGGGTSITVGHFGKDADRGERGSSNFRASFDTVIWIEKHHKDDDTGIHTIQLWVVKQKDSDDGKRIWLQSQPVDVPVEDGETQNDHAKNSLVLIPISEVDGRTILQSKSEKAKHSAKQTFEEEVVAALHALIPGGGHIQTKTLAKHLVEKDLGPHVSGDEEAKIIERMRTRLRRARTTGLKRYAYTTPQGYRGVVLADGRCGSRPSERNYRRDQ